MISCLNNIKQKYALRRVVIVPGGGPFAEQVRLAQKTWLFDDRTAHCMAILAMQQMALLMDAICPGLVIVGSCRAINQIHVPGNQHMVWSPDIAELDNAGIASSWDITSDSLAAWLASSVSAEQLILVKSAEVDPRLSFQELTDLGIVDPCFCDFAAQVHGKINIINARQWL